jgi:hypothetical protein
MKTIITESVHIFGLGKGPRVKTTFNSVESDSAKYYDISKLSGDRIEVDYSYTESEAVKKGRAIITVPSDLTESGVKTHIITAINAVLNA